MIRRRASIIGNGRNMIRLIGYVADAEVSSLTLPAGIVESDIVVVVGGYLGGTSPATPTDYTSLKTQTATSIGARMSRKIMGPTPDTTVSGLDATDTIHIAAIFRNVDTTTPMDATTLSNSGNFNPANPGSITTVSDGSLIVIAAMINHDAAITPPSGYSVIAGSLRVGAQEPYLVMAYNPYPVSPGAHDPGAFSDPGNLANLTFTAALRRA